MSFLSKGNTLLLRIALAFAFLYPPIDSIFNPNAWIGFFPQFILQFASTLGVSNVMLLGAWGIVEIIIALWVLSGRHIFLPSLAAAALLCLIVLFNIPLMEIVFRDIALALVALTLACWSFRGSNASPHVM